MIRDATWNDRSDFLRMWTDLLHYQFSVGFGIIPSEASINWFLGLFRGYTEGYLFGACPLWFPDDSDTPQGLCMFGEQRSSDSAPEFKYGKIAVGWGLYVGHDYRKLGVSQKILAYCHLKGRELGFDTLMCETGYHDKIGRRYLESYNDGETLTPDTVRYYGPLSKEQI